MLGSICAVTFAVPDLDAVEHAYCGFLGMRVVSRAAVPARVAENWGAPAFAGRRLLVLCPESGSQTSLRFIEDETACVFAPCKTFGWNATEFTVQDTDALAERLAGSPFRIIGPPANLKGFDWIRAMQVIGPAGECLYFTDVGGDATLAQATCPVSQVFITVAAGPDIGEMIAFHGRHFGNPISAPVAVPVGVINRAHLLPAETRHRLALVTLTGGTRIELDEYPAVATARPARPGHLAPGMAIVSFRAEKFPEHGLIAPPAPCGIAPFENHSAACMAGAAGELLELIGQG